MAHEPKALLGVKPSKETYPVIAGETMLGSLIFYLAGGMLFGALLGEATFGSMTIGVFFGLSFGIMFFFLFGKR